MVLVMAGIGNDMLYVCNIVTSFMDHDFQFLLGKSSHVPAIHDEIELVNHRRPPRDKLIRHHAGIDVLPPAGNHGAGMAKEHTYREIVSIPVATLLDGDRMRDGAPRKQERGEEEPHGHSGSFPVSPRAVQAASFLSGGAASNSVRATPSTSVR